jgi:hypothetical protein
MMKLKAKLKHPVGLAAQGFVFGVILFWATAPSESSAETATQAAPAAIHATL